MSLSVVYVSADPPLSLLMKSTTENVYPKFLFGSSEEFCIVYVFQLCPVATAAGLLFTNNFLKPPKVGHC